MAFIRFLGFMLFGSIVLLPNFVLAQSSAAEESLAAALAAATTSPAREALLASQPKLHTPALVKALIPHGTKLRDQGKYADALELFQFAHAIATKLNDPPSLAQTNYSIGYVHFLQANHTPAIEWLERSQGLYEALGDQAGLAFALNALGQIYNRQRQADKALRTFHQALALRENLGDKRALAVTLNLLGAMYSSLQQFEQAELYLQRASQLRAELGDHLGMANALNVRANNARSQGKLQLALTLSQQALDAYQKLGRKHEVGMAISNITQTHIALGNYPQAQTLAQQSLQIRKELGDKLGIVTSLSVLSESLIYQGDYNRGLAILHQALARNEQLADPLYSAILLENIASVHRSQGNIRLSLDYYEKSLQQYEKLNHRDYFPPVLQNIGLALVSLGRREEAFAPLQRGLQIAEELQSPKMAGSILAALGLVIAEKKQATAAEQQTARSYLQRSLQTLETIGARGEMIATLLAIATLGLQQGDTVQAFEAAEKARLIATEIGDQNQLIAALTILGKVQQQQKRYSQAVATLTQAIATYDHFRSNLAGGANDRRRNLASNYAPYQTLIECLLAQKHEAEAFHYAEQVKARTLMEVLQTGKNRITGRITGAEQQQEQAIQAELVALNLQVQRLKEFPNPDPTKLAALEKAQAQARFRREAFETQLYNAHPELQVQRGETQAMQWEETASLVPDASTALLEFVVTDHQTILFVITRSPGNQATSVALHTYRLPLGRTALAEKVESFRQRLATIQPHWRTPARQLYNLLVQPAQAQLRGKTQLIVSPDGPLWELPFQALTNPTGRTLLETAALSYAPSLTVLREMRKPRAPANEKNVLLAFGNPTVGAQAKALRQIAPRSTPMDPLPDAEREVNALQNLYGASAARVYLGAAAREDRAKAEATSYAILHFATHGVLDDASPLYSRLVLAQGDANEDGMLEAWEIMRLNLQARLAVLSACETARGQIGTGEGMIGLSWAFFIAGCPTTIASQWKVDSATTAKLMLDFHRRLRGDRQKPPLPIAQSLQQASLQLLRQGGITSHPFFWAGFVAVGNGL